MSKQNQGSKKKARKVGYFKREAKRSEERRKEAVLRNSSSTVDELVEVLGVRLK